MKYKVILAFLIVIALESSFMLAQEKKEVQKKEKKADKIVIGGIIGLQFGTITSVDISPVAGYNITPKVLISIGLSYRYYRESYFSAVFSSNIFGLRSGISYTFLDNIGKNLAVKTNFGLYAHLEYELLNLDRDFSSTSQTSSVRVKRFWLPGVLIGGGIKQPIGNSGFFNLAVLYNIIANDRTPYDNPFLRIGIFFYI